MISSGQLALTINDGENKDNYIALYDGDTSGQTYDNTNRFYGDTTNNDPITENGYISILINENTYYVPLYKGTNTTDCCSNLVGSYDSGIGVFTYVGWVLIKINGNKFKWTPICTKN
jgi:hypothetical protein